MEIIDFGTYYKYDREFDRNSNSYYNINTGKHINRNNSTNKFEEISINKDAIMVLNEQNAYDEQYVKTLIANRKFLEAAKYMSQYRYKDPNEQYKRENEIFDLKRKERINSVMYQTIKPNSIQDQAIKFYHNFDNNSLGYVDNIEDNVYYKSYINKIDLLFGIDKDSKVPRKPTENDYLEIKIDSPKNTLFGGLDWIRKDYRYGMQEILDIIGYNEIELRNLGIECASNTDNSGIIRIKRNHNEFNNIIGKLSHALYDKSFLENIRDEFDWLVPADKNIKIFVKDENGEEINGDIFHVGKDKKDALEIINILLDDVKNTAEKVDKTINEKEQVHSSLIGELITDDYQQYIDMYESGMLTASEFNNITRQYDQYTNDVVKSMGYHTKMYSNAANELGNAVLEEVSAHNREILRNIISGAKKENLHYNAMSSDGEVGTLITIDAGSISEEVLELIKSSDLNLAKQNGSIQVFVPGLFADDANESLGRNTQFLAERELDDLSYYGYSYTTNDGKSIYTDEDGYKIKTKNDDGSSNIQTIPFDEKQKIVNLINKDIAIEQLNTNLKFAFMNDEGELITNNSIERAEDLYNQIVVAAYQLAEEMYPGVPLLWQEELSTNSDPAVAYKENLEKIISKKGAGNKLGNQYRGLYNYKMIEKYDEFYDIFTQLLENITDYDKVMNFRKQIKSLENKK